MKEISNQLFRVTLGPEEVFEYVIAKNLADAVEAGEEIAIRYNSEVRCIMMLSHHVYRI